MSETQGLTNSRAVARELNRKQVLLLAGMGVAILVIYFALGSLLLTRKPAAGAVEFAQAVEPKVLATAYQQAADLAAGWQPDAQLVSASTSWQLASGDRLTLHRPTWTFSYYSPSAGQVQMITVSGAGAELSRRTRADKAPAPVTADWSLDSDDLLLTFMANGGEAFLKLYSFVNIHAQLWADKAGRSIWYVSAVDPVARESLTIGIDALSRQVVVQ